MPLLYNGSDQNPCNRSINTRPNDKPRNQMVETTQNTELQPVLLHCRMMRMIVTTITTKADAIIWLTHFTLLTAKSELHNAPWSFNPSSKVRSSLPSQPRIALPIIYYFLSLFLFQLKIAYTSSFSGKLY